MKATMLRNLVGALEVLTRAFQAELEEQGGRRPVKRHVQQARERALAVMQAHPSPNMGWVARKLARKAGVSVSRTAWALKHLEREGLVYRTHALKGRGHLWHLTADIDLMPDPHHTEAELEALMQ